MTETSDKAVEAAEAEFYRTQGDMSAALSAALPHLGAAGVAVPGEDETISAYEFMAREFDRLAILRKMWSAGEVAATIRKMAIPSPSETRSALVPSPVPQEAEPGEQPMATALGGDDWRIDTSAGSPILVYQDCSVIQDDQAEYVLSLIRRDQAPVPQEAEPVARTRAELLERLSNWLDPEIGFPDDDLLRRIHADVEMRGRKDPAFAVSVHHRNIMLSAAASALRNSHLSWKGFLAVPQEATAEPVADWPLWCSKAANDVLTVFGYAHNISLYAGDARRDRIAKVIAAASPPSHDAELLAAREWLRKLVEDHYDDWMDGYPDDFKIAIVTKFSLSELRAFRAALATAASQEGR